ncbi:MAG: LytTR family DNA-binding domain-containing protein [Acutalibacteraceae bacterium]|nr:LytTR family DNA-binding domain-containing protein [Acutalibacteraceae bacterium]
MKILICDDDIKIVEFINNKLQKYMQENNIKMHIDAFTDSKQAFLVNNAYDIAFVDVEMPEVGGLELATQLKRKNNNIFVFIITSHDCYLDDAMDISVFRYLSKPIDDSRLLRGLDSALKHYQTDTHTIALEYYDELYTIYTSDILYITTEKRKTIIFTKTEKYTSNKNISYWRNVLHTLSCFAYPHHSYIINLQYVTKLNKNDVTLEFNSDRYVLPVSQRGYSNFKKAYFSYIGAQL